MTVSSLVFNPPVIAHRGASAYAPENTMSAFIKAAQLGVKWIEFDVMQSASGETIIFHDELLNRTSNAKGKVSKFSFCYLQSLDVGSWFNFAFASERIPTLLTVIHFLRDAKMSANIEIKAEPGQEKKIVTKILKEMSPYLLSENNNFIFSSFSIETLNCLRKLSPHCQIGLLLHAWEENWESICNSLQCVSVHVNHEIMTEDAARKIKDMGKILLCYTVNNKKRANELFSWGVDAVFSDAPDKIL